VEENKVDKEKADADAIVKAQLWRENMNIIASNMLSNKATN
jgi:hypothetical protein